MLTGYNNGVFLFFMRRLVLREFSVASLPNTAGAGASSDEMHANPPQFFTSVTKVICMKLQWLFLVPLFAFFSGCNSEHKSGSESADNKSVFVERWEKCKQKIMPQLDGDTALIQEPLAGDLEANQSSSANGWRITVAFSDKKGPGMGICTTDKDGNPMSVQLSYLE